MVAGGLQEERVVSVEGLSARSLEDIEQDTEESLGGKEAEASRGKESEIRSKGRGTAIQAIVRE